MKIIDRIVEAIGLVEEEEIYEDEPAATSQERRSIFKAKPGLMHREKESEEAAGAGSEARRQEQREPASAAERREKPALRAAEAKTETQESVKPARKPFFSFGGGKARTEMTNRTIEMPIDNKPVQVIVLEPVSFDDSQKVADYLRGSQPVVINFEGTDGVVAKRMTDFVSGTLYALNGTMKKIGRNILVCAPRNVNIDAGAAMQDEGQAENPWKK